MNLPGTRKDPTLATILSLFFPGAGYLYVGVPQRFLLALGVELTLFCLLGRSTPGFLFAVFVHVCFAISAGGAARMANERNDLAAPPPPPVVGSAFERRRTVPPAPPPPPSVRAAAVAAGPPLDADEFLAELREAWTSHSSGAATDEEFERRKLSAIERVRVADLDDGIALLESTAALVGAGVMTEAERSRLRLRVGRR